MIQLILAYTLLISEPSPRGTSMVVLIDMGSAPIDAVFVTVEIRVAAPHAQQPTETTRDLAGLETTATVLRSPYARFLHAEVGTHGYRRPGPK